VILPHLVFLASPPPCPSFAEFSADDLGNGLLGRQGVGLAVRALDLPEGLLVVVGHLDSLV